MCEHLHADQITTQEAKTIREHDDTLVEIYADAKSGTVNFIKT